MVMTMIGGGLLWVGWFGFNAGSSVASGLSTAQALTATQVAAVGKGDAQVHSIPIAQPSRPRATFNRWRSRCVRRRWVAGRCVTVWDPPHTGVRMTTPLRVGGPDRRTDDDGPAPTIAVLAGGRSTRFGSDKAAARIGGRSLLAITLDHALAVGDRVLVVGRAAAADLAVDPDVRRRIEVVPDRRPDLGPVGGLLTASELVAGPVVLLGCDQPAIDARVLRWLIASPRSGPAQRGVLPVVDDQPQLCAALYPQRVHAVCARVLAGARRSLRAVAAASDMRRVTPPADWHWRFAGCNTPQDLERLAARLEASGDQR